MLETPWHRFDLRQARFPEKNHKKLITTESIIRIKNIILLFAAMTVLTQL